MDKLVTVAVFTFPHEAAVVKGRLESEGLQCYLKDEFTVQVNSLYSNAVGGVKLQVLESDVALAKTILSDTNYAVDDNAIEPDLIDRVASTNDLVCPNCGSAEVFKEKVSAGAFVVGVLLLGFPLLLRSKRFHCFNCNSDFTKR